MTTQKRISFDDVRNNNIKSWFLILLFLGLVGCIGLVLGYVWGSSYSGFVLAIVVGSIYALIAYYSGKDMVLSLTHAKPAAKKDYPHLVNAVEGLAIAAGVPTPKVFIIHDSARNAFATGRNPENAAITVTSGLLESLNREELEGVIAHEMHHIKNYDIRMMLIAAVITGVIVLLSDILLRTVLYGGNRRSSDNRGAGILIFAGLILAILSPIIAELLRLAVSRKREFAADAGAITLTRYPPGLANALKKIKSDPDPLVDTANKATAHLFISSPFRKANGFLMNLFNTHPPIDERIKLLEQM